jgi:DNA recombination protein RmuC
MSGVSDVALFAGILLLLVLVGLTAALLLTRPDRALAALAERVDGLDRAQERTERGLREEVARGRTESAAALQAMRAEVEASGRTLRDALLSGMGELTRLHQAQLDTIVGRLDASAESQARRLGELRVTVEQQLAAIREENAARLEAIRETVDTRLQTTLEERLGASFRLVSEQLEQVHRGLGEMQALAAGVGDLKRVLANVKARGVWGEVQLGALLEQVLAPDQYAANVATREGTNERVEFAVRLPGPGGGDGDVVWLPIDAKFPLEDYQRLLDAVDRADPAGAEQAGRDLEQRIRQSARDIRDKYLNVPRTTDFAILFLPAEGLYAEVLRRPGLADTLQREYRVLVAGPTTLWAMLSSLRMGFRTLAIQRRSGEVWALLGQVKSEFSRFGALLDAVQKKIAEASKKIDEARSGSRRIERRLRDVQELPAAERPGAPAGAPLFEAAGDEEEEGEAEEPTR